MWSTPTGGQLATVNGKLLDKLGEWYLATTNITDDPDVGSALHDLCLNVAILSEQLDGTVHID